MVVTDTTDTLPTERAETSHTRQIVLFAVLISVALVVAALCLNTGWGVAAEMVSRFSVLIFAVSMIVEPLARMIPLAAMRTLGRERGSLVLAFAAASAISLIAVIAPFESLSVPTIAYSVFTALILVVMLFSANPATIRLLGAPAWRAMQRIATAYFWLVFTLSGVEHLIGPHRPDSWYGFSLLLLVGALLVRFADSFVAHWHGAVEKAA